MAEEQVGTPGGGTPGGTDGGLSQPPGHSAKLSEATRDMPVQGFSDFGLPNPADMTEAENRDLFNLAVIDADGQFEKMPKSTREKFIAEVYRRGFEKKNIEDAKARAEKSKNWLEDEQDKIADRETLDLLAKARQKLSILVGGEKQCEATLKKSNAVLEAAGSEKDLDFLEESGHGVDPRTIVAISRLADHEDLWPLVKKIGLQNILKIGVAMLYPKRRK